MARTKRKKVLTKKQTAKKVILNLGAGKVRIPNSINVDLVNVPGYTDLVHDLDETPYPFKNNSVDEIHLYHVLEHLKDPLKKIEEMHRILKVGGTLYLRVPHFSSLGAFTDLTHIRPFAYSSFDCLEKHHYHHFYTNVEFRIVSKEIKYFGMYPNSGVYEKYVHRNYCAWYLRPLVLIINGLIKISPMTFERLWCYWVGGATEVVVTLRKAAV